MKNYLATLTTILLAGTMFLGSGTTAGAQGASQQPEEIPAQHPPQQAPNDSAAARVSFIHGDLSTQHSDSSEWVAATLNTPVVYGDHISTGKRSRAEIQLDNANVLRMSDESTANVVNLSRTQIQLQIGQGLVNYEVLRNSEANVEIDTPNVAIRPQMNEGSYRITVNSDGETIVDVRQGSAEVSTSQGSTRVDKDQRITIQGTADNAQYNVSAAYNKDDWDKWNADRDHVIEGAASWRHTDHYYTGTHDLDTYGHWSDVPDYGSVWFPEGGADWAPYRDGRWVFEPYYGWTWVSAEPWGWAPYHYGRWFVYGGNWGWWPGPVVQDYRPIWAPAYVSFFGFGGGGLSVGVGFGFGDGFGSIGWLPCGPGDRFYPWYGGGHDREYGRGYGRGDTNVNVVNSTNITNITNINNNYGGVAPLREGSRGYSNVQKAFSDPHVRSGISSMGSTQFGHGAVPAHQQSINAGSLRQASVITAGHPVAPTRDSFRPSDRQVSPGAIPSKATTNQRFYSNARAAGSPQAQNAQGGFNRGGNPAVNQPQQNANRSGNSGANQPQQNTNRPGFRSFGPGSNSGNTNRGAVPEQSGQPPQGNAQNQRVFVPPSGRQVPSNSSPRSFGPSNNPGNANRGTVPEQSGRPPQGNAQNQRGFTPPSQPQAPSNPSTRPGWRPFNPPNRSAQPEAGAGNSGGQARPNYSQPSEPSRQSQNNSRGDSGGSGYGRPPLNMQQPVVTPRGGGYSSPRGTPNGGSYSPPRSAPSGGSYSPPRSAPGGGSYSAPRSAPSGGSYPAPHPAPSGGGNRGGSAGGSYGGGNSGGGSRGGESRGGGGSPPSGSGGHTSPGRNNR